MARCTGIFLQARIDDQSEAQPKNTEQNADHQQAMTVDAKEQYLGEIGKLQSWLRRPLRGPDWARAEIEPRLRTAMVAATVRVR